MAMGTRGSEGEHVLRMTLYIYKCNKCIKNIYPPFYIFIDLNIVYFWNIGDILRNTKSFQNNFKILTS